MKTFLEKIQILHPLYLVTFLFALTFFIYANTFTNELFFDDEQFIYNNQAVQTFSISEFFTHSLVTESGRLSNYYRPLLFFTFGIEYQLVGNHGFLYHFDSMMIHIAGGIVLFLFLNKLFSRQSLAFLTSLFWLIHPLQTEAVSYASGRGDSLSFLFVILTLYLSLFKTKRFFLFSILTCSLALLSKEIALILPGLIFITTFVQEKSFSLQTARKSFVTALPYLLITFFYFFLRITILDFANTLNFYNSENIYSSNLFVRLNTFFHLLPEYIKLLLYPKDLFMERDLLIEIKTQLTPQSGFAFFTCLGLFLLGIKFFKKYPLFLFSLLWFAITFTPTSGIIPINGVFYEHFLYYPSIGFFLLLSSGFLFLIKRLPRLEWIFIIFLFCIIALLSIRTIVRNNDWHDSIRFYESTNKYVQSPRIYNNLAMSYADTNNYQKAIPLYKKAITLSDTYPQTHFNLANAYVEQGNIKRAEKEYKETLRLDPAFYRAHINLYRLYTSTSNTEGKEWVKKELLKLSETYPDFRLLIEQLEKEF